MKRKHNRKVQENLNVMLSIMFKEKKQGKMVINKAVEETILKAFSTLKIILTKNLNNVRKSKMLKYIFLNETNI